jgi:phosphohistidine phosphatase SixA
MRKLLLALVVALATVAWQPATAADKVYVMRHLQKAEGNDPPLSVEGGANARKLVAVLGKRKINAIFATPTRRAVETAEPVAKKLKLTITSYDPRDPAALKKAVDAIKGAALIVGHSNTVPEIVAQFGGGQVGPLADTDYGTIFVVTPDPSPQPSPARGEGTTDTRSAHARQRHRRQTRRRVVRRHHVRRPRVRERQHEIRPRRQVDRIPEFEPNRLPLPRREHVPQDLRPDRAVAGVKSLVGGQDQRHARRRQHRPVAVVDHANDGRPGAADRGRSALADRGRRDGQVRAIADQPGGVELVAGGADDQEPVVECDDDGRLLAQDTAEVRRRRRRRRLGSPTGQGRQYHVERARRGSRSQRSRC